MSLGKDLATIRNGLGLSLEEVQSIIKIPVYTLKSIESDGIYDSPEYNDTYIRNFIRSYARALKIDDALVVQALDSVEADLYTPGSLLEKMDVKTGKPLINPDVLDNMEDAEPESIFKKPDIETKVQEPTPTVETIDWVNLGKRFGNEEVRPKMWGALLIIAAIVIVGLLTFIYRAEIFGIFSSSDEPEVRTSETVQQPEPALSDDIILLPADTTSNATNTNLTPSIPVQTPTSETPTANPPQEQQEASVQPSLGNPFEVLYSPTLSDTLTISVFSAFDKLEPVRVTSDFNWRTNPFWMEQGQAFNFNFQDTILVRGQYSRMMLLFNGHIIENADERFYNEDFDSIMLTREALSTTGFLSLPPSTLPENVLIPDSLVFPISY